MQVETCPRCDEKFGHHGGPFIQCSHCGHVVKSIMKSRPPNRPTTARERHRQDDEDMYPRDRDYSGDPPELDFG